MADCHVYLQEMVCLLIRWLSDIFIYKRRHIYLECNLSLCLFSCRSIVYFLHTTIAVFTQHGRSAALGSKQEARTANCASDTLGNLFWRQHNATDGTEGMWTHGLHYEMWNMVARSDLWFHATCGQIPILFISRKKCRNIYVNDCYSSAITMVLHSFY